MHQLKDLPNLRALYLAHTRITDRAVAILSTFLQLNTLNVENTAVTDNGLLMLSKRTNLDFILLNGCNVSLQAVGALRKRFPKATVRFDK